MLRDLSESKGKTVESFRENADSSKILRDNAAMEMTLRLSKMETDLSGQLTYSLSQDNQVFEFTKFLGKKVSIKFSGNIFCENCGKKTKKPYAGGFCFPCSIKLASCDMCILKPETCHYEQGTCREPEWGLANCFRPHIVYLANSSGLKVGITRESQVPTRWIDQGATQALGILRVKDRKTSGLIEMILKKHVNDKTDWRKMLKGKSEDLDLKHHATELLAQCAAELEGLAIEKLDWQITTIDYPVLSYPEKVKSLGLEKNPEIEGVLTGIKGQYLMFENTVINIRAHSGFEVSIQGEL